ncbi:MAG: FabA/FabZ family ACP-dehydratase, partial [Planctomycetota bacterium]
TTAQTQPDQAERAADGRRLLFDLSPIDLSAVLADTEGVERVNPHRHEMRLLDEVIFVAEDHSRAVGRLRVSHEPFWARGHFPSRPTMPGVLMVEAGAQIASYLWNIQQTTPRVAAFLRIEEAVFRRAIAPGEEIILLAAEVKNSRRRFISDVQGLVDGEVAFSARISGLAMEEHRSA